LTTPVGEGDQVRLETDAAADPAITAHGLVAETERLILRRLNPGDAPFILGLLNEPSFITFIGDKGVRTLDDARDYIVKGQIASYERFGFGLYLTALKSDSTPIGIAGLVKREALEDVDIGFAFLPAFWSHGYALEAADAVMKHALGELAIPRVVAITNRDNISSIRLLEKLGLRFKEVVRVTADGHELKLFAPLIEGAADESGKQRF
jgi:ribosomal-protein-alanine N-acetyltransferase